MLDVLREAACSVNPGPGATGIQAHSAFHPQSLSEKNGPTRGGCWRTLQELRPSATCDSFLWKMSLHVTQQACLWIFADSSGDVGIGRVWLRVSLYFWFICLWTSTHTHHRPTEDIMPLWSQARLTESASSTRGSELEWRANGCDTATKAIRLFLFIDDSV